RSFCATDLASLIKATASALEPARSFLCSSRAALASAFIRSASASCCLICASRSSARLSNAGHANLRSRKNSAAKTRIVQKKMPNLGSNGDLGSTRSACSWSSNSNVSIMSSRHELEEQREHERDDRHAFEQHADQDRDAADVGDGGRLARDRLGGLPADAAQADAGTDDGEAHADTGTEQRVEVLGRVDTHGGA